MRFPLRIALSGMTLLCAVPPAAGQARVGAAESFLTPAPFPVPMQHQVAAPPGPEPAAAFLYSLLLPGGGQYALGQRRWVAYLAAEAAALAFLLDRRGEGIDRRGEYRDLAWQTARAGVVPRTDPGFEYYERLAHWSRSGAFDTEAGTPGLQPETDPTTYNGSIWALAASIYPGAGSEADPNHERALDYYRARAYPDPLAWDWSAHQGAHLRFQELIERSDDAFRTATVAAGLLLTNHILSATDAFITARLRRVSGGRVEGSLGVRPSGRGVWRLGLKLSR